MKAIEILDCIGYMGLSGEYLTKIEVPDEYDEFEPQTEEWWMNMVGAIPPTPIAAGTYILVYSGEWLETSLMRRLRTQTEMIFIFILWRTDV